MTFDPHPIAVLRPEHAPPTLTTLETRAALLEAAGADDVLVLPFDRDVAAWTPEQFVEHRARRRAARARRRGRRELPVRREGRRRRRHAHRAGPRPRLHRRGHPARRRAAGVVLDVRPQLPALRRRRRRRGGAGPPVHGARRGRQGRPARPRARLPDRQRAHPRHAGGARRRRLRRLAAAPRRPGRHAAAGRDQRRHQPDLRAASGSAASSPTCSTATTSSCTASQVEVSFVGRIRGMLRFDSVDELVETMADDVARTRELLR